MRALLLAVIRIYQATISPDHGWSRRLGAQGRCKFFPSCSEYTYQSIKKYGVLSGVSKAVWRIIRCNPLARGGIDEP